MLWDDNIVTDRSSCEISPPQFISNPGSNLATTVRCPLEKFWSLVCVKSQLVEHLEIIIDAARLMENKTPMFSSSKMDNIGRLVDHVVSKLRAFLYRRY